MTAGKLSPKRLAAAKRQRDKINADPVKREAHRLYMKEYRQKNLQKIQERDKEYRKTRKLHVRLVRKKLNVAEHFDNIHTHSGLCDICGQPGDGRWRKLNIDHSHKTGEYRGMLCSRCNRGIGFFADDPELLIKAAAYLMAQREILEEAA